ncbi:MAG: hypothetical protein KF708_16115 [Pirellulales bacterium]|nr:hypothetical protein [Pirellulales bacterium]
MSGIQLRVTTWGVSFVLSMVGASHAVRAEPLYSYRFDQASYTVSPGAAFPVSVYLRETFDSGDPTLLDTDGLLTAGVRVRFDVPTVPSDPARVVAPGDISANPAFDMSPFIELVPNASAGIGASVDFFSPAVTALTGPGFHEIWLGTFTFSAGTVGGEVTQLVATDLDLTTDDILTENSFLILDPFVADGFAYVTVTVPEPSAGMIAAAGALMLLVAAHRRGGCS